MVSDGGIRRFGGGGRYGGSSRGSSGKLDHGTNYHIIIIKGQIIVSLQPLLWDWNTTNHL